MKAQVPASERRRLEVLWEYDLLDTPPEEDLDTLTHLARQVCQTPIALISLLDHQRQWFKSKVGVNLTQTPREASFCGQAIRQDRVLIVPDATRDPRFANSPLVTGEPRVRFYAGVPLIGTGGLALGTLCVMDREPRELLADQVESLRLIAGLVMQRLEARRHLRQATRQEQQTATLARTVAELETEVHRRKRAELERQRYADVVRNIQLGLLVWEIEDGNVPATLRLVAANPAASLTLGVPLEVMVGKTLGEILPRWGASDLAQRCVEVGQLGGAVDLGCIPYEDERVAHRDYAVRAFALPDHCVGLALENITDRRLAELAQVEIQARKAAILDSAPDAIVTIDHDGNVFEWNAAAERIFGYRRAFMLGKELASTAFSPASRDRLREALAMYLRIGESPLMGRRVELTGRRVDGTVFPVEISVARVPKEGSPIFTGFIREITERKRFEEALRASQALYSSLVESLPQSVFRKDTESRFTFANTKFCTTLGRRLEDIIGHTDDDFFTREIAERSQRDDQRSMETGESVEGVEEREFPGQGRRFVQSIKSPIYNAAGKVVGVQGMFWDITERVQLEEQLRQIQKMETVGQLAGGVAHDFNNLLTVIQGHASILLAASGLKANEVTSLQQISLAADRAAYLTRQLLTFSRKQMIQLAVLDVNELVQRLADLLRRTIGESSTLDTQLDPGLPAVQADPVMLEQVLLNLAANARDAMPRGGQLTIRTSVAAVDAEFAAQRADVQPGRYVCLTVSDTGAGIPHEHLPHIFEPFFTTKEVGRGTGLGLATVYGVVQQHQGWIAVDSEVGRGTAFRIHLPAVTAKPAAPALPPALPARGGRETILIVEDEPALRSLVRSILERSGYAVLDAPSGRAALSVWQEHRDDIDLLLTDMVMPDGMNGRELALRLQEEKPALQVLYTSGYSTDIVGINFALEEGVNFLAKPYAPRRLAETVRNCLDQRQAVQG